MATKVIKTTYSVTVAYPSNVGLAHFRFETIMDMKAWLGQLNSYGGNNATFTINKIDVVWDDSTKYLTTVTTPLNAGDL